MSSTGISSIGRLVLAAKNVPLLSGQHSSSTSNNGSNVFSDVLLMAGPSQSNAGYAETQDGAFIALAQAVSFYLHAIGTPQILSSWANAGEPGTEVGGIGVMEISTPSQYSNSFLSNIAGANYTAATAAVAPLGLCGTGYSAYVTAMTANQKANVQALICYWGEQDSMEYEPQDKTVYVAAMKNLLGQVRRMLGTTAAKTPVIVFGPPYGLAPNWWNRPPTIREGWMELADDVEENVIWAVQQTYDTLSRQELWDAITGVASGGNVDGGHRSSVDNVALFKRAGIATAKAILTSNGLPASLIPPSLGSGLGPEIVDAQLNGTVLMLTVRHDGGDDLVVPLLAGQGVGFSLMDGGSTASPGNFIKATACDRVDATHLAVTLASSPLSPHTECRLMYPWPGVFWSSQPDTEIGRGCAVTDNFASVAKPAGFDINATYGVGWGANVPLRTPVVINNGVAAYGFPLSS